MTTATRPAILIGESDLRKLLTLGGSEELSAELERARVVADADLPGDAVRMGSTVRYRSETGAEREVTLVYPSDADISTGRISVLTPVGTALLGMVAGNVIAFEGRNGREQSVEVVSVR
jgi:Transcription elongation factor